jgi:hypothetical protein
MDDEYRKLSQRVALSVAGKSLSEKDFRELSFYLRHYRDSKGLRTGGRRGREKAGWGRNELG